MSSMKCNSTLSLFKKRSYLSQYHSLVFTLDSSNKKIYTNRFGKNNVFFIKRVLKYFFISSIFSGKNVFGLSIYYFLRISFIYQNRFYSFSRIFHFFQGKNYSTIQKLVNILFKFVFCFGSLICSVIIILS